MNTISEKIHLTKQMLIEIDLSMFFQLDINKILDNPYFGTKKGHSYECPSEKVDHLV